MERPWFYILKDGKPVPVEGAIEWGKFFENTDARRVANDNLGPFNIFGPEGKGVETDVWGRYTSVEGARAGHEAALAHVRAALAERVMRARGIRGRRTKRG
jgi:hypothetical protein